MKTFTIIGAGRLGKTLGFLTQNHTDYLVQSIVNKSLKSATESCAFVSAGQALSWENNWPEVDFYMLSVPDTQIEPTAVQLAQIMGEKLKGKVAFHCSGASSANALQALRDCGMTVASVHPAYSFADPSHAIKHFAGTLCAVEGDEAAIASLVPWVRAIGGKAFVLTERNKALYHASLSIASNYLVALNDWALSIAESAGVPKSLLPALIHPLMTKTLENVGRIGCVSGLTGPIARGDINTVNMHLAALQAEDKKLYGLLGERALRLAKAQGLDQEKSQALSDVLQAAYLASVDK